MSFESYFNTYNFDNYDARFGCGSSWSMPAFSEMPLFSSDYSSFVPSIPPAPSIPSYTFGTSLWSNYSLETGYQSGASNAYDFRSLASLPINRSTVAAPTSFQAASTPLEAPVSVAAERTVTPTGGSKYKRPRFKSTEAARLWDGFSAKASAFNPKKDLGPEFLAKVKEIAGEIGCEYRDLLSLMQVESGLNPYIPNLAGYGAYGLIQFQPDTLRGLGYQPEDLLKMTPVQQLDIVKKHLVSAKKSTGLTGKINGGQLYGLVFSPGYVNRSYFYAAGSKGYNANSGLDTKYGNNNGKIEKSDLQASLNANRVNENIFVA